MSNFPTQQCLAHFVPPGTRGTKWTDSKTEPRLFSDLTEASQAPDKCSLALLAAFRVPYNTWKLRFGKVGSFRTPQVGSFRRGFWSISHPMFQGGYEMSWALQIWVGSTFSSFFRTSKKSKKSIRLIFYLNNFYFLKIFFEKYSPYEIWAPSNWVLKTLLKSEALLRDILSDTTERTV